jgi:phosphatidylserine decarboxylase
MTIASRLAEILAQEDLNFLLTNRIPRRFANRFIGWFSQIESPLLAKISIRIWRLFTDLDLSASKTQRFKSLHECFTRELKDGARPVDFDPQVMTSPCDAVIGACGTIDGDVLIQAKGFSYTLQDLLLDPQLVDRYVDGLFVTLRLKSSMYHRFHAPHDCSIERVIYVPGDTWNVNPVALKRVSRLYCKNERAVMPIILRESGQMVTLVPVAAILVASIRLHFLPTLLSANYHGDVEISCDASFNKGEELGWFQHGSTIIVLAPKGFTLCDAVQEGRTINMGRPLMRLRSNAGGTDEAVERGARNSVGTGGS